MRHALTTVKHSQLVRSADNRTVKRSQENVKARAQSIYALGVIQSIVVSPAKEKGKYVLHAGEGRYDSVELLIKEGSATNAFEYPALVADDAENVTALIRLAENANRDNLHPVDEFLTYQAAIDEGRDIKAVANFNGVTQKYVRQRMKLAALSPVILNALRADEIDLDAAEAYTLGKTHEEQEGVFNALGFHSQSSQFSIRNAIKEDAITQASSIARFVGKDAYKKAGGTVTTDLFDTAEYWDDKPLLLSLADEKLQRAADSLSGGWKWVETTTSIEGAHRAISATDFLTPDGYNLSEEVRSEEKGLMAELEALEEKPMEDFTDDDRDRMSQVEDRLDAIEDERRESPIYDPQKKAVAGCIISIGYNGKLVTERGRVRKEDRAALQAISGGGEQGFPLENFAAVNTPEDVDGGYSQALKSDLADTRTAIIQATVSASPDAAYDLGVFSLAETLLRNGHMGWSPRATSISIHKNELSGADEDALAFLDKAKQRLNLTWTEGGGAERFASFCALSKPQKAAIFAHCVAVGITSQMAGGHGEPEALAATIERVKPNYRGAWTPTKETFFKRIPRGELIDIGSELFGAEWAQGNAKSKKGDLTKEMEAAFRGELELPDDQKERVTQWTPKGF